MQVGMTLEQKQTIHISLTPELRQSLNLLQFSTMEIKEFLHQVELENPLLEIKENKENEFFTGKYRETGLSYKDSSQDYDVVFSTKKQLNLEEHLMEQVNTLLYVTNKQKNILKYLIYSLNEQGFLKIELANIARTFSVSLDKAEQVVSILQSLDPIGVGARDLRECLLLQLDHMGYFNSLAYALVENYLEDVGEKRYTKLAELMNLSIQEIQVAFDLIQTLNPRPCSQFHTGITDYIAPDVIIEKVNQDYMIVVNDEMIPTISINSAYHDLLESGPEEVTGYLKEKYQQVMTLMNGITQRKLTLYKVVKAIVEKQRAFFQEGFIGLKPMTLKVIATELGYHESTISRAISNKYIQTPHGLFQIKSLFTSGFSHNDSSEMDSPVVVKAKIKELVNQEDKRKPYSDQILLKLLEQEGISISRRTIAKYREEIGIQSSVKRKRF
ncbi:MAG TPA: RNA polymerase factor sigma-54 [Ureibacillus sp.]|nr:RNA polymerase factor sigma-54 [Ureibacillus sp.]